jgi:hypothetical protein
VDEVGLLVRDNVDESRVLMLNPLRSWRQTCDVSKFREVTQERSARAVTIDAAWNLRTARTACAPRTRLPRTPRSARDQR